MSTVPGQQSESSKQQTLQEQLLGAEVAGFVVQTEARKLDAEDQSFQLRADQGLKKLETEDKRAKQEADIHDQELRTASEILLNEEKAKAELSDQQLRTAEDLENKRRDSRTTQVERYFFMVIFAIGIAATIVLAFKTSHQNALGYRLSPMTGLLIAGGSGFKLGLLRREQGREDQGQGSGRGEEEKAD